MQIYYHTFGCKVNQYETEKIKEKFQEEGFSTSDILEESDVCVVNSCTVTAVSDKKCRQFINKVKATNPNCITILAGCLPQAFTEKTEKIENVDIITGTKDKTQIPLLLKEYLLSKERISKVSPFNKNDIYEEMSVKDYSDKTRAFVKIEDGCNQFCSYCIIPYARGRVRSKPLDKLKIEIEELANNGYKEIVLVGINLSCYGEDLGLRLTDAVETVCSVEKIKRVRLGSLEAERLSEDDIELLAKQKKLCPHFHLSLQSGCDKTLKNMNRKYDSAAFYSLVLKLRELFEDCAITTDVIVGFPDETEEDFNLSMEFCKKVKFSQTHIFPYSIREGTVAAKMKGQLPKNIKSERASKLAEELAPIEEEFLKNQIGKIFPVLFEKENSTNFHRGYTPNYTLVKIYVENFEKSLKKEIFYVKIKEYEKDCCVGEIIN